MDCRATTFPPFRPLQVHLSTAIVLMFVAGALWWANLRTRERSEIGQVFYRENSQNKAGQSVEFF
jgi:hypothetical protein